MSDSTEKTVRERKPRAIRPKAEDRPVGMSEEVWKLGTSIGSVAMAAAIVATDDGVLPSDPEALNDFLVVTSGEATKALKQYVKLNSTIGKKLSEAYREWRTHKEREARLFAIIANGGTLPETPNGEASAR